MREIPRTHSNRLVNDRYGKDYEEFMGMVDGLIRYVTEDYDSEDFADTFFKVDRWKDGENPADTAEEILNGDEVGHQWLEAFKQGEL